MEAFFPGKGIGLGFSLSGAAKLLYRPLVRPWAADLFVEKNSVSGFGGPQKVVNSRKKSWEVICNPQLFSRNIAFFKLGTIKAGWLGRVFFEKKLGSDGWGAHFLRKSLGPMAGARILQEKAQAGWLARVFLKKKLGSDGWGAYFSRKAWVGWLGRVFFEKTLGSVG